MLTIILLQIGAFLQGSAETFYTWNTYVVAGMSYKEHRVGFFHQQAKINGGGQYIRQGMYAEAHLGQIDNIAHFYGGMRLAQSNDRFWGVTPHATVSFRIIKYVEIPITFSIYASRMVNSIGLRFMFVRPPRSKVCDPQRRALQPTSLHPIPKF